jgi:carbapenam-3-carboxylate synthase
MGQLPLWRHDGEGFCAWSPEAKAFVAVAGAAPVWRPSAEILAVTPRARTHSPYVNLVRELPPGLPPAFAPVAPELALPDFPAASEALAEALLASMDALEPEAIGGACLSGGVDSSVAVALLAGRRGPFPVYTLGTRLGNEFAEAGELATHLGLPLRKVHLPEERVVDLWSRVVFANEVYDGMSAEILMQVAALCEAAAGGAARLLTGYGSDLLFGGMLSHGAYMEAVGVRDTAGLIERTRWSMELSPFFAWALGVRLVHLYWHPAVVEAAMRIPLSLQQVGGGEKHVLRETAVQRRWLERPHAFRPKIGMTIGTAAHQLLASSLRLPEAYAYPAKSADALRRLQAAFVRGEPA